MNLQMTSSLLTASTNLLVRWSSASARLDPKMVVISHFEVLAYFIYDLLQ